MEITGLLLNLPWQAEQLPPHLTVDGVLAKLPAAGVITYLYNHIDDARVVPMLWAVQPGAAFEEASALARQEPERYWLLGNEPDRRDQSNTSPQVFVDALRRWPSKYVILPGIDLSEGGYAWFREFVTLWRKQVGGIPWRWRWSVHCYAYTPDDLNARWTRFRRLCVELRCHRPTLITEFASAQAGTAAQMEMFDAGLRLMRNDKYLVGLAWFSVHYGSFRPEWTRSDLLDARGNLTAVGQGLRQRAFAAQERGDELFLPLATA